MLELYFIRFLFVCFETERATSLGTTSVNVYIAVYQICAISAGVLADKVIGTKKGENRVSRVPTGNFIHCL